MLPTLATVPCKYGHLLCLDQDTVITESLRRYGEWAEHELSVLSQYVKPGSTILDVGANIGTHALALASMHDNVHVHAIEAQPVVYAALMVNSVRYGNGQITPHHAICSSRIGLISAAFDYHHTTNFGAISLALTTSPTCFTSNTLNRPAWRIPMVPLDEILVNGPIDLIKIDAEGMEFDVLSGAQRLLNRYRPVVFLEQTDTNTLAKIYNLLSQYDYHCHWLETHPFNINNFLGNPDNIWHQTEMAILALPKTLRASCDLPYVIGTEAEVPRRLNARAGTHVRIAWT